MNNEEKLINDIRDLRDVLGNSEWETTRLQIEGKNIEEQVTHMVTTYPEVWGPHGSMRFWLERKCEELGINTDVDPWDHGMGPGDLGTN